MKFEPVKKRLFEVVAVTEKLRVTGGSHRGRRVLSPPKNTIRPASDLVRQAVFNMLGDSIIDAVFFDVFAGTGIVGIEALSRGASRAIFIERDRRQLQLIRQNLRRVDLAESASVRGSDAFVWAKHFFPVPNPTIVFLGPPYPLFDTDMARLMEMVTVLQSQLDTQDLLVLQMPNHIEVAQLPDSDNWFRFRQYGKTIVGIWQRPQPDEEAEPQADTEAADGEGN